MKKVITIAMGVFLGLVLCIIVSLVMCSIPLIDSPKKTPSLIPLDEYTPSPEAPDLGKVEVLSFRCYPDPDLPSTSHVVGEVKNQGSKTVEWVKIITTFYDSEGDMTYTDFTYCMPKTLKPNQSCTFDSWMDSSGESTKCGVRVTYR